jgi:hypothetical protein
MDLVQVQVSGCSASSIAVPAPLSGRKPWMPSKMMVLDMHSLMIVDITFHVDSSSPMPLTPPSLLGISTRMEKQVDVGSSSDLKQ